MEKVSWLPEPWWETEHRDLPKRSRAISSRYRLTTVKWGTFLHEAEKRFARNFGSESEYMIQKAGFICWISICGDGVGVLAAELFDPGVYELVAVR